MIKISNNQQKRIVLDFLREYITDCLYMYLDILHYNIEDNDIDIWVNNEKNIEIVIMRYHTSISFITEFINKYLVDIANIINSNRIFSITARKNLTDVLYLYLKKYNYETGWIFKDVNYRDCGDIVDIQLAKVDDIPEIVKLVCSDYGIGSYYNENDLCNQYLNRMKEYFGRNYFIRENNKIVAHIATYAEQDKIAVVSGLIVDAKTRNDINKNYGYIIENFMFQQLLFEGFDVYNMVTTQNRYKLMKNTQVEVGRYGKLFISHTKNNERIKISI